MQIVESYSGATPNGRNDPKQPGVYMPKIKYMMFKFDTGHTYQRFVDGVEFFTAAGRGQLLNEKSKNGPKLIAEMRNLTAN
jgi:hypothetical protein